MATKSSIYRMLADIQKSLRTGKSPYQVTGADVGDGSGTGEDESLMLARVHGFIRNALLLIPGFFVLYLLRDFLTSIMISLIFFAALFPLFNHKFLFLEDRPKLRSMLVVVVFILTCLVPITVTLYSAFLASKEVLFSFGSSQDPNGPMHLSTDGLVDGILHAIEQNEVVTKLSEKFGVSASEVLQSVRKSKSLIQGYALQFANNFLTSLPETFIKILIVLALLYSFLAGSDQLAHSMRRSTLFSGAEKRMLFESFLTASAGTVVGTVLSGLAQSSIICVTALIVGHSNPLLIGALTFLASFFPLIGTASVSITLIAHGLFTGHMNNVIAFSISGALAGMADNIILPLVVGRQAMVHPLFTLMCALGAIAQFGFFGIFIGPVAGAFAWTALKIAFAKPQNVEIVDHTGRP